MLNGIRLSTAPVAEATRSRSPGVSSAAFCAQPPDLRFAPLMDTDFAVSCPLVRRWRLVSGFCPSTRTFDPCYFQTPPRGGSPCIITRPSPPSGWPEDLHLQAAEHAQHTTKWPRLRLRPQTPRVWYLQASDALLWPSTDAARANLPVFGTPLFPNSCNSNPIERNATGIPSNGVIESAPVRAIFRSRTASAGAFRYNANVYLSELRPTFPEEAPLAERRAHEPHRAARSAPASAAPPVQESGIRLGPRLQRILDYSYVGRKFPPPRSKVPDMMSRPLRRVTAASILLVPQSRKRVLTRGAAGRQEAGGESDCDQQCSHGRHSQRVTRTYLVQ